MTLSSIHHSFDIELAKKYGIEEAILIHHFQHWIRINKEMQRNSYEGKTWTYQSMQEIAAHFPYLNKSKICDLLEKLCTGKHRKSKKDVMEFEPVLVKGNFNKSPYDRTVWYAFRDESLWRLGNPKIQNELSQNENCDNPTPIPHTKPYALTDKKEEGTVSPPSAPPHSPNSSRPPRKKVIEEKIQRAPEVYLTETQHVTMLKKCEGNEKLREMAYNELSDWKIGKGITGGRNDFKSASGWALEKARQTAMDNPIEKNMQLVAKLKNKHSSNPNINFGHNYIEFVRGALNVTCIKFTDASFIEQVFTQLKKMNINPGDL